MDGGARGSGRSWGWVGLFGGVGWAGWGSVRRVEQGVAPFGLIILKGQTMECPFGLVGGWRLLAYRLLARGRHMLTRNSAVPSMIDFGEVTLMRNVREV
ncbi:hypothetical protein SAMN04487818_101141 [Actinokineospora terrae]|uniref:Uncharacterized protein n=1 Tax=Actinokineospora terrae TaxID=155974 RepID=A0A1H9KEC5_9PSEU|nr:hypothetical protein SAMN04487818_101141 [Actinokineospora terrae]